MNYYGNSHDNYDANGRLVGDPDYDPPESLFQENCRYCEQVKAGKRDISYRFYDDAFAQYVHALWRANTADWTTLVPCNCAEELQ